MALGGHGLAALAWRSVRFVFRRSTPWPTGRTTRTADRGRRCPMLPHVAPCCPGVQAAAAVAAKLQDSDAKVANAAWAAIRKRLGDADPDVNRVWLEEVHCHELNPSVRGEAGQVWWQILTAFCLA